jgi:hypothetical protein
MFVWEGGIGKAGSSVGELWIDSHVVFYSGGLELEADDFSADPGSPGWDTLRVRSLTFADDSTLDIQLVSLDRVLGTSGLATGFNSLKRYSLPVIVSDEGVNGFDKATFSIDTTKFANDFAGGRFYLKQVGNSIDLVYSPPPGSLEVFSVGMEVPESISRVPTGFGAIGGQLLVPDPGFGRDGPFRIWAVPADGGAPVEFVTTAALSVDDEFPNGGPTSNGLLGGLFLPSNFGNVGGRYLTTVTQAKYDQVNDVFHEHMRIITIDGSGNIEDWRRQVPIATRHRLRNTSAGVR